MAAISAKYKIYLSGAWVEYAFTPAPHTHLITDLPAIPQSKITNLTTDFYTKANIQNDAIYMRNALVNANGVPTNNLGSPSLAEMALIDEQFDNKTAFYPISSLTVETFNGTTWTDITSSISDTAKKRFFGGDNIAGIVIPNGTLKYAITIRNVVSYAYLNALYMYWSSNGNSTLVHIWKKRDDGAWTQHTSSSTKVSSWPGHLFLPFPTIPWMPSGGDTHQHLVRVEFTPTWSHATNGITLDKMQWWGGYPASKRNLFSTDENKVVSFPAALNANGQAVVLNNDSRLVTPTEKTTWNGKEPAIAAATPDPTLKYWRGDKTWATLPSSLSTSGGTVSGDITLSPAETTQADQKAIKWKPIASRNPYFGYALDQTDGTFVWSITGTNYASGLAIGGGSGNLLYKGGVVVTANNISSYALTSLSLAASGTRGGIQIGYAANGKNYPVVLSSEKAYVNVPWENTTYGYATSTTAGLVKISVSGTTVNIITS